MCHTQGRGGQYNFEEPIHLDDKAKEASHSHIKGTLPEEGHTVEGELQRGG